MNQVAVNAVVVVLIAVLLGFAAVIWRALARDLAAAGTRRHTPSQAFTAQERADFALWNHELTGQIGDQA
jgi:type III secretory pathway component EscV